MHALSAERSVSSFALRGIRMSHASCVDKRLNAHIQYSTDSTFIRISLSINETPRGMEASSSGAPTLDWHVLLSVPEASFREPAPARLRRVEGVFTNHLRDLEYPGHSMSE